MRKIGWSQTSASLTKPNTWGKLIMKHKAIKLAVTTGLLSFGLLLSGNVQAATTVTVGTSGQPKPYTYVDSNNKLTGYDIEVLRAIDKVIPAYKFNYKKTEITAVLGGVDSGRYQIGANNFGWNPQRAKKYTYSNPVFDDSYAIVVRKGNNSIKSLADIGGHSVASQTGVNFTLAIENYNKEHPKNKAKLTYTSSEVPKVLQDVQAGKYDFALLDAPLYKNIDQQYKFTNLKMIVLKKSDVKKIGVPHSYFLTAKDAQGEKINKALNHGLTKLEKDGTLKKISQKFFGADYSPKSE